MSLEENKALVRRYFQVWGKGNLEVVDELTAPDFTFYYPFLQRLLHGAEAYKQVVRRIHSGLADPSIDLEEVIAEGDKVVVLWTLSGTNRGELIGRPPTGKQVKWTGISIFHFRDDKIVHERGEEDIHGLLQQLVAPIAS